MADLTKKSGSAFDLLRDPTYTTKLVAGSVTACETCCDTPCLCQDPVTGGYYYKEWVCPEDYPGACTYSPTLSCRCLTADYSDETTTPGSLPAATITISGNGNGYAPYTSCSAPYGGCDWSLSFALNCDQTKAYLKYQFVCYDATQRRSYWGLGDGYGVDIYYYFRATASYSHYNSGYYVPGSVEPSVMLQVWLGTGLYGALPGSSVSPTTWTDVGGGLVSSNVTKSYRWRLDGGYMFRPLDQTKCPHPDCGWEGKMVPCSPSLSSVSGFPYQSGSNYGCDPGPVTVSYSL